MLLAQYQVPDLEACGGDENRAFMGLTNARGVLLSHAGKTLMALMQPIVEAANKKK